MFLFYPSFFFFFFVFFTLLLSIFKYFLIETFLTRKKNNYYSFSFFLPPSIPPPISSRIPEREININKLFDVDDYSIHNVYIYLFEIKYYLLSSYFINSFSWEFYFITLCVYIYSIRTIVIRTKRLILFIISTYKRYLQTNSKFQWETLYSSFINIRAFPVIQKLSSKSVFLNLFSSVRDARLIRRIIIFLCSTKSQKTLLPTETAHKNGWNSGKNTYDTR